jgi:hypothetical protein
MCGVRSIAKSIVIDVYKNFSLCKSLLELDIVLNAEFMLIVFYLYYDISAGTSYKYYFLAGDIFFAVLIVFTNIYTHIIVRAFNFLLTSLFID